MRKFDITFRGYDKTQVQSCLDEIISAYESLLNKSKRSEAEIERLKSELVRYQTLESTLNRALFTAESAGDQIKKSARIEAESLMNEAKRNANRIINDALMQAEKVQNNADTLRRNINIYKRRIKSIIETQLDVIDEIEIIDFRSYDRDDI